MESSRSPSQLSVSGKQRTQGRGGKEEGGGKEGGNSGKTRKKEKKERREGVENTRKIKTDGTQNAHHLYTNKT